MLVVPDDHFTFLCAKRAPLASIEARLAIEIHAADLALTPGFFGGQATEYDVLEHSRDDLLARP